MNETSCIEIVRVLLSEHGLLARIFFASIEVTVLAVIVAMLIRVRRIRSPRIASLLWLVVLLKPIVSLAIGSPVPVACLEPTLTTKNVADREPENVLADMFETAPVEPTTSDAPLVIPAPKPFVWEGRMVGDQSVMTPELDADLELAAEIPARPASESLAKNLIADGVLGTWLVAVGILLVRYLLSLARLRRIVAAGSDPGEPVREIYASIASQLGLRRTPRLVLTDAFDSPAMAGVFRPVVLVPSWLAEQPDCPELHWSLKHELMHWRWLDPAAIAVRDLATTLFSFHPVVWWAARNQTEAIELACDQAVVHGDDEAVAYAEQLYQILKNVRHRRQAALAGGLFATRTQIGKRVAALLDGARISPRRLTAVSVIGVLLLACSALAVGGRVRDWDDAEEPAAQQRQEPSASGDRELCFPTKCSLGTLSISGPRSLEQYVLAGWTPIGAAKGTVRVPRDKLIRLTVSRSGVRHLADLRQLKPDDLYALALHSEALDSPRGRRADLSPIRHLAGLRAIDLFSRTRGDEIWALVARLKSLESIDGGCPKMTDRALKHVTGLESLRRFALHDAPGITDAGLAHLRNAKGLELLRVVGSPGVTDAGLAHLRNAKGLKRLTLVHTSVTGRGLSRLRCDDSLRYLCLDEGGKGRIDLSSVAKMKALRVVGISYSRLEPSDMAILGSLPALEELNLYGSALGKGGLKHLASLGSLKELILTGTNVTDAEMNELADPAFAKSLRKLRLDRTGVTDKGLRHIGQLAALEMLDLPRGTTDAMLTRLGQLTKLKTLDMQGTQMKGTGLGALAELKSVTILKLPASGVSDSDLAVLTRLGQVEELVVQGRRKGTGLTESGLTNLSRLRSLRRLVLCQAEITDKGLAALKGLPLKNMEFLKCRPKGKGFARLGDLPQLEELQFLVTPLREEDLVGFGKLKKLKRLQIISCKTLDDRAIPHLAGARSLESLFLGFPVTDASLVHLKDFGKLTDLHIEGDISAEGLAHLEGLPSLRALSIRSSHRISRTSLRRLRGTLPALESLNYTHQPEPRVKLGDDAPRFSFTTVDGERGRLTDYRGKVVLLYFWSTSCSPCVASLPSLKKAYETEHRDHQGFRMLSLCVGSHQSTFRKLVEKHRLTWPQIYVATKSRVTAEYGVARLPMYVLVDRRGKVAYVGHCDRKLEVALNKAYEQASDKPKRKPKRVTSKSAR